MGGANITSIVGWFVDPIKEQMKVMAEATNITSIVGWFVDPIKEQMKVMAEATITSIVGIVGWFVAPIKVQMKVMAAATIISIVGNWFVNPIKEQMKYLFNLRGNLTNLKNAVRALEDTRKKIEEKIRWATEARDDEVPTKNVEEWLNKVQTAENEVAEIEGDHNRLKMCFGGCPLNCWSGYRVSKRAANSLAEVKELLDEEGKMGAVTETIIPAHRPMLDRALSLPATEILLGDAIKYLKDETVGMIGICGMGGVGKTTLLKKINNHREVKSDGYLVIWIVVSQEFNLDRLQRDIAKRVIPKRDRLEFEQNATTELQADILRRYLENKKFLLLLDDIWRVVDLEELGIPGLRSSDNNRHSSKVVFTTRSEKLYDQMAARNAQRGHEKIKVECLKPEEAWELFFNEIGEIVQKIITSDRRVRDRAETVAKRCAGLPLALVVIARAMSSNKTYHEWEFAINSINDLRDLQELCVEGTDPLYPVLKFSYDRLNDQMRKCFLCCALWPEDHDIPKDELIRRWLGMGLIADFSSINEAISKGHSIIEGLKGAAMLEEAVLNDRYFTICVKLHDIIRGMALWIASDCGENRNKWIVGTGIKTSTIIVAHEAEIVSLMYSEVDNLSQFPYCPNLTALMLQWYRAYEVDVDGFIKNVPALTYLDLSKCLWSSVIVTNRLVEKLSNVLIGLQCLDLSGCEDLSLPKELVNLTKLKYLFIRNSLIRSMPHGLISGLQKLEILDLSYSVYWRWEEKDEASVAELGCINAAGGLKAVGIELKPPLLQRLSSINHPHVPPLWHLQIQPDWGKRLQTQLRLSKSLFPGGIFPRSLHTLELSYLKNVEEMFIAGCKEDRLDNLERLKFYEFRKLIKISWDGGVVPGVLFRNLSYLYLYACLKLEDVSWIAQLPLEILIIIECHVLEQVIGGAEDDDGEGEIQEQDGIEAKAEAAATENRAEILPNLKFLKLVNLPRLNSFCSPQITFPSLQHVEIRGCPQLDLSFLKETTAKVQKDSLSDEEDVIEHT